MGEGLGRTKGEEGEEIESREVNPDGENPLIQSRRGVWMVGMTYLITIGVIFLLVLGKNVPYHPQKFVYEYFLEHTFFRFDPFTHIIISVDPQPNVGEFSYLSYLGATSIGGPLLFLFYAYIMSLATLEWKRFSSFRREAMMTAKALFVTSPILAVVLQKYFSCEWGKLYYDSDLLSPSSSSSSSSSHSLLYTYVLSPFLFWALSDATFYWGHRFWHIPFLYKYSHYYHHSCRPTTSFAGNAADVFEIVFTGYLAALLPILIVPLHARVFLILTIFSHVWTIFLHNNNARRIGMYIYDSKDHNIHHYYGQKNYNYALYFQFWDRLLGTYRSAVPSSSRLKE